MTSREIGAWLAGGRARRALGPLDLAGQDNDDLARILADEDAALAALTDDTVWWRWWRCGWWAADAMEHHL